MPLSDAEGACGWCRLHPPQAIDTIRSVAFFEDGAMRPAIHQFKYHNLRALGQDLAALMLERAGHRLPPIDVIVPVPLHPARQRERGYNQSEIIARHLAAALHLPADSRTLQRSRNTASQAGLNGAARQQNVAGAFTCVSSALAHKSVLLVDDVCTTGATLDACAFALKQGRARAVHGLTLARAD